MQAWVLVGNAMQRSIGYGFHMLGRFSYYGTRAQHRSPSIAVDIDTQSNFVSIDAIYLMPPESTSSSPGEPACEGPYVRR